jgi:hypothetical protein
VSTLLWRLQRYILPAVRVAAAVLGLALAVLGVVLLFSTDNSAGALFVIGVAAACLLVALLAPRLRIQSFGVLGAEIAVRDVVGERLEIARSPGTDSNEARAQARALRNYADLYEHVRRTQPPGRARTAALDRLAGRVQRAARDIPFDPAEVATWFHDGDDALRIVALNVMIARSECRDFMAVLEGIESSRSAFEQYYALRLGREMLDEGLDPVERDALAQTVHRALLSRRMSHDANRAAVAKAILTQLQEPAPPERGR